MNPEFKKEEMKYFKNLVEIQLGITKVVLEEHKVIVDNLWYLKPKTFKTKI